MSTYGYPQRPLGQIILKLRVLYDVFGELSFTREELRSSIGFGSQNGAFKAAIFSMEKYGLLKILEKDYLIITDRGQKICQNQDLLSNLTRAAFSSSIFSSLLEVCGPYGKNDKPLILSDVEKQCQKLGLSGKYTPKQAATSFYLTIKYLKNNGWPASAQIAPRRLEESIQ